MICAAIADASRGVTRPSPLTSAHASRPGVAVRLTPGVPVAAGVLGAAVRVAAAVRSRVGDGRGVASRVETAVGGRPHGGDGVLGSHRGGLNGTHGGDEGTYGAHSGRGVGVAHGGDVWFGAQIGGLGGEGMQSYGGVKLMHPQCHRAG